MIHKMDTATLQDQLAQLWKAKTRNASHGDLSYGICARCPLAVRRLMFNWPESTGNEGYPVPAPSNIGPRRTFWGTPEEQAYWTLDRWAGEYGGSRIRLLNYMIRRIERELAKRAA
jgi:hypothetical protein